MSTVGSTPHRDQFSVQDVPIAAPKSLLFGDAVNEALMRQRTDTA
jgi:hypothetical protein